MKNIFLGCLLTVALIAQTSMVTAQTTQALKMAKAWGYMQQANSSNAAKAHTLFSECAELGNAEAMNALGVQYRLGMGVGANTAMAQQWFVKAANTGYAKAWYNLGLMAKDSQQFTQAYQYFTKAASANETMGIYAQAYMQYKGLGCNQNYQQAAAQFAQTAYRGLQNGMYFYGLCLRNGYGVAAHKDSARYWLLQAAEKGYRMAADELASKEPEKATLAGSMAQRIKAAQALAPQQKANSYQKIPHQIAVSDVAGIYTGYLLKYDWSGQHVIEATPLQVTLNYHNDSLIGSWQEGDSLQIPLQALVTPKALVFGKMQYRKSNHYSPKGELTVFDKAQLQLTKTTDAVYVAGNIQQYLPGRNEPAKPQYVALVRSSSISSSQMLSVVNADGSLLSSKPLLAYPNPFGSSITVDFELTEAAPVTTQISTLQGKVVYSNAAGVLAAGHYTLPIQTQQISAGYYVVMIKYGKQVKSTKIVKL